MKGRSFSLVLIGCLIVIVVVGGYMCLYGPVTTVVLVRHAEKAPTGGPDPPLSPDGIARAQALSHVVESAGIDAIFATEYKRTQATVAPAAAKLGITTVVMPAANTEGLVHAIISEHKGKTILVAGHSDTVPAILLALGIPAPPAIADGEYDKLFVVHILHSIGRHTHLTYLKYGNPSP